MALVPSDGGKFELFLDGEQLFSKLKTGQFPSSRDVIKLIDARLEK